MTESRLFKIIYYLMEKGQATAPELAEKFEVSAVSYTHLTLPTTERV